MRPNTWIVKSRKQQDQQSSSIGKPKDKPVSKVIPVIQRAVMIKTLRGVRK